jgi:hypothetical protein
LKSRKQKSEPSKLIRRIQHGRVHFCYVIGLSMILIWTDAKTDWPEMPEYMQIYFAIETPDANWASLKKPDFDFGYEYLETEYERTLTRIEKTILAAIKKKIANQRKAGTTMKPVALKETGSGRRAAQKQFLPFE